MTELRLVAPLEGWCTPLDEVPDEVFASRMMGDGLAIDPTAATLHAPCDGELTAVPVTGHAVTLRAANGAEFLLHVGIDTVELCGAGFEIHVHQGQHVKAGQPLISFDLDLLARRARSLVTPIVLTDVEHYSIVERHEPGTVRVGDHLMTLRASTVVAAPAPGIATTAAVHALRVPLPHGLHARPAALLAQSLKGLYADVSLSLRGRTVNARSAVAIMSLGAQLGDDISVHATGVDAAAVIGALDGALQRAARLGDPGAEAGSRTQGPAVVAPAGTLPAVIVSGGLALGRAAILVRPEPEVPELGAGAAHERDVLELARDRVQRRLARQMQVSGGARAEIIGAHLEFLDDPELLAAAHALIAEGKSAGFAWRTVLRANVRELESLGDDHLAARVDDLRDLEAQVLMELPGRAVPAAAALPERAIVIAEDLLLSQLIALDSTRLVGICTVGGGSTSHVAILAAAMDLPMLAGADPRVLAIADGTMVVLDAESGHLRVDPEPGEIARIERRITARRERQMAMRAAAQQDCRTADGVRVEVLANIVSVADAEIAIANGAEGCGLLRTEFLFLDRNEPPDEHEQTRHYQQVVDCFAGRAVVIRTLDAGSDKPIPFLPMPRQENPALGLRGIRASLSQPALLRSQLRAVLAVQPQGCCRILLPMVNDVTEIRAVRRLLDEIRAGTGVQTPVALGIMIETPASAVGAERLAREADFFSIGTNDLAQYTLAIDRTHPELAAQLDALHPAVLRLIESATAAARSMGRSVAVCGGLASDPVAVPILLGLGVHELSVVPAMIPAIKAEVRSHTLGHCQEFAQRALRQDSASAVRALVVRTES
jgi:phosphocarrier protein FPr/phosphocarrier protein